MTEVGLYLIDEDYGNWPPPCFIETYDYLKRPPYKVISQYRIENLASVVRFKSPSLLPFRFPSPLNKVSLLTATSHLKEIFKTTPNLFRLIFEESKETQEITCWEVSCAREKFRTQFISLLNVSWNRLFQADLSITNL